MKSEVSLIQIQIQEELQTLKKLACEIFPQTYQSILSKPQITYMLDKMYAIDVMLAQVHHGVLFYLLKIEEEYIGYLSIEFLDGAKNQLHIHKIYIHPNFQGRGLGKWMMQEVEQMAKAKNVKCIALNVNRYNKAKRFYKRLGFKVLHEEDIAIGKGYFMNDYVMVKQL